MADVAYFRVSTAQQGASGLGLDAQREAVRAFLRREPDRAYIEVESGKRADRPELARALADCRKTKARLIVAKLDRLSRQMSFVAALMDSKVDFVCCDNPHANRLTLHILAAVAEDEARRISERTRAALAAAKARGQKLGSDARSAEERKRICAIARAGRKPKPNQPALLAPAIRELSAKGRLQSEIAKALGCSQSTVSRALSGAGLEPAPSEVLPLSPGKLG